MADDNKEVFPQSAEIICPDSANLSSGAVSLEDTEEIIETLHDKEFPKIEIINLETTSSLEVKEKYKTITTMAMKPLNVANKFSSFNKTIRVMAHCKKITNKCKREEGL